jgi:DHA1 family inner membrane transport protein
MIPFVIPAVGSCHAALGLMTGIDVLRRAEANAQLVGAFNVSAINVGIMLGAITGGLLIDHIGLTFIGCLGEGSYCLRCWSGFAWRRPSLQSDLLLAG